MAAKMVVQMAFETAASTAELTAEKRVVLTVVLAGYSVGQMEKKKADLRDRLTAAMMARWKASRKASTMVVQMDVWSVGSMAGPRD